MVFRSMILLCLFILCALSLVTNAVTVKVGLSGKKDSMLIENAVFHMAAKNFADEGLLDKDLSVELYSNASLGCNADFDSVTNVAEMYYLDGVRAFIGPECSIEMGVAARMAAVWNVPILGYGSSAGYLADKVTYPTLARVSTVNTNGLTNSLITLIKHYKWTRVALVNGATSDGNAERRSADFRLNFPANGINIVADVTFPIGATAQTIAASKDLLNIKDNARIIVAMFGVELAYFNDFVEAVQIAGMRTTDYVYLLPDIVNDPDDYDNSKNGSINFAMMNGQGFYENMIIVKNNGFEKNSAQAFIEHLKSISSSKIVANMTGLTIAYTMQLYDAFKLYVVTLRSAINETGNPNIYLNGTYLWNKMRSIRLKGITDEIAMDDIAEQIPFYTAYYISNLMIPSQLASFEAKRIPDCDGMINRTGCYGWTLVNINTDAFVPPADEPICGYTGSKCSKTVPILVAVALCIAVIGIALAFWFYRRYKESQLFLMPWRIRPEDICFVNSIKDHNSTMSLGSISGLTTISKMPQIEGRRIAVLKNVTVTVRSFAQRSPISFNKRELQLLLQMRESAHDNLNQFFGMCFNNPDADLMILWKHCSRGTLHDLILDKKVTFDDNFRSAFIGDIVKGLEYLHSSAIGFHGYLNARSCQVDEHWNLKLSDYGIEGVVYKWKFAEYIAIVPGEMLPQNDWIFVAPELATWNLSQQTANTPDSKKRMHPATEQLQLADMYSFGMILFKVIFRKEPFQEMESFAAMMAVLNFEPSRGQQPIRPIIPKDARCHPDLLTLMRQCWSQEPHLRPSLKRAKNVTTTAMNAKGNLADQIFQMMERYSTNLEQTIRERTALLEETKQQSESLLKQILPSSIADNLRMGLSIRPKNYFSATVLFSDIVGFTRLCSSSTPMEVVALLNHLFSGFDKIVRQHDACKIETIGDSYLVVSGIPTPNGTQHAMDIANIALEMRKFLDEFRVPHRPNERLQCRWGCHSGSVTAAVVGMTSPRYAVLGETVIIASAMEKSSIKGMIHSSAATFRLLARHYPEFKCKLRGQFNIEGVGTCTTFYIMAKNIVKPKEEKEYM